MQYGLADNMIQSIFWGDQQTALNTQEETISLRKVSHTYKARNMFISRSDLKFNVLGFLD